MLDILIGSRPLAELPDDSKKDAVKQNVLKILNEKYGIEEEDFLSAELEIVPAGKAREGGLDHAPGFYEFAAQILFYACCRTKHKIEI